MKWIIGDVPEGRNAVVPLDLGLFAVKTATNQFPISGHHLLLPDPIPWTEGLPNVSSNRDDELYLQRIEKPYSGNSMRVDSGGFIYNHIANTCGGSKYSPIKGYLKLPRFTKETP